MAGNRFTVATGEVATTTSARTILQILAGSNVGVYVKRIGVSFDGITSTDAPIRVRILRQSTAGTMSSLTPRKLDSDNGDTLQATALHTATVEPTAGDVLFSDQVHPQRDFTWILPFGEWLYLHGGDRLGVEVLAGVDVNCIASMLCEE